MARDSLVVHPDAEAPVDDAPRDWLTALLEGDPEPLAQLVRQCSEVAAEAVDREESGRGKPQH